uniref:Titin n=1 Tax=Nothobranchius furzeri TaxID=105023 RepID=A0A8C6LA80_NOTFU
MIVIKDSVRIDGGTYILLLTNEAGSETVPFNVVVLDRPSPCEGPLLITGVAEDKCTLSWREPLHDGGSPIAHYIIERRETSRLAWTVISSSSTTTWYKVTKLMEGNEYMFRVMAVNSNGISDPLESAAVIMRNPCVPPGSPHIEDVSNVAHDGMTITWSAPETDGGSKITNYIVEKKDRAGIKWTRCNRQKVTDLSYRVVGLTTDHEYEFRVTAENIVGVGEPSLPTSYYKACDPKYKPGAPSSASLSWEKPEHDGGSRIGGYLIEMQPKGTDKWGVATNTKTCEGTVTGLTAGTEYLFRIIAYNEKGKSEPKALAAPVIASDMTLEPSIRTQFNTYSVLAGKDLKLEFLVFGRPKPKVSWIRDGQALKVTSRVNVFNTPSTTGIQITEACKDDFGKYSITATNTVMTKDRASISVKEAMRGDGGKYYLTLENVTGAKTFAIEVNVTGRPSPPAGPIEISSITSESCVVNWQPPEDDGGTDITNYIVEKRESGSTVTAKLGQPAVMKCQIVGRPVPEIKWYHADKEIVESRKYEMSTDGRTHSLTIMTDQQEDEGEYTCKAINDAGEAEATGTLVLEAASSFHPDYPLKETYYAGLGTTLRIHAVYIGRPQPKIMWLHGAKTLENTEDISIETTEHYTHLVIKNDSCVVFWKPPLNDGGSKIKSYCLEKKNKKDKKEWTDWTLVTTDEIKQTVFSVKHLTEGTEYIFRVKCENLGGESDYSEETTPIIPATAVEVRAPAFKEELRNMSVKYKSNATLVCKITGQPKPVIKWFRRGKEIHSDGKKIKIQEFKGGYHQLVITEVTRADDGTYRCKVVNEYGEDSTYAELFVTGVRSYQDFFTTRVVRRTKRRIDTSRMLQKPPEFTLPLVNRTAYLGEDVRFGVTITVHPEPRVIWHKSGQKLIPGHDDKKYTFISDKGLYQLIIHNLEKEDDAEYSVVARNRYGDDSCKARLTVVPRPKPADLTLRPMFKRLLANVECKEGQNIRFEIRVSGHPKLKWEKDGTPLAFGPSIEVVHEGLDYYILHVKDTLPEDSGVYRVTATNSAGSASCQATLKVERCYLRGH